MNRPNIAAKQAAEAFSTFHRTGMHALFLGNYLIEKSSIDQHTRW